MTTLTGKQLKKELKKEKLKSEALSEDGRGEE